MIDGLDGNMLNGLGALEHLLMNDNAISRLGNRVFDSLTGLIRLHLQHNLLSELSDDVFTSSLGRLEELFLQNNVLVRLESGVFNNLVGMSKL